MTKVGVIGNGRFGSIIVEALENGKAPECELVGVATRSSGVTVRDLLDRGAEIIIEAAKPDVLKGCLIDILNAGVSVIPLSTGALADEEFAQKVREAARANHAQVYLPHGAEGAFDLAATYSLVSGMKGTVIQYIPERVPGSMNPFAAIPEHFEGSALEGFALSPGHLNVLIAASYACGGFENTRYESRIPENGKAGFAFKIEDDISVAELTISGKAPAPGINPMAHVALSAVALLNRITAPITF